MHLTEIVRATRRTYNEQAEAYATTTSTLGQFPGLSDDLDRFVAQLPGGPVLDLGCGTGRDTEHLLANGLAVVAGDLSERMLAMTRDRCPAAAIVQLDLLDLPFRDAVFGGVWACASVLHVPRYAHRRSFAELARVLRPGGVAAISLQAGVADGWRLSKRLPCERWFALRDSVSVEAELVSVGLTTPRTHRNSRGTWFITEAGKP